MATSVDWSKGEQTALVSIGTHNLSLTSYGPDRQAGEQVVACIPGLASSTKYSPPLPLYPIASLNLTQNPQSMGNNNPPPQTPPAKLHLRPLRFRTQRELAFTIYINQHRSRTRFTPKSRTHRTTIYLHRTLLGRHPRARISPDTERQRDRAR